MILQLAEMASIFSVFLLSAYFSLSPDSNSFSLSLSSLMVAISLSVILFLCYVIFVANILRVSDSNACMSRIFTSVRNGGRRMVFVATQYWSLL